MIHLAQVFTDQRSKRELEAARVIEQARLDAALEAHWRKRIAINIAGRVHDKVARFLAAKGIT
jgi:hypothetical protein